MFYFCKSKYKNLVRWCQFRSHCCIYAPNVTWFTSHWLPCLILPLQRPYSHHVVSLSCQIPHHHHPNFYSIHFTFSIQSPSLTPFSLSYFIYLDSFCFLKTNSSDKKNSNVSKNITSYVKDKNSLQTQILESEGSKSL